MRKVPAQRELAGRHLAVFRRRRDAHLFRRHVAGHDEDRVVRRIVVQIEILRIDAADVAHFVRPADHGAAIGMRKIERGIHLLAHQRLRIVVHAHAALFQNHAAFGVHVGIGEIEIDQAVGIQMHHQLELVLAICS